MIDPDAIQIQRANLVDKISMEDIPEMEEVNPYNLEDDKEYAKYIKDVKYAVRKSFEYKSFINYLRENLDMDKCSFIKGVSNNEGFDIRIEIHHYPFSLEDIVEIVFKKRSYYKENISVWMVAKEVMSLHYKLIVGLIPLSETVHELTHKHRIFIPIDKIYGRYDLFVTYYKPFCTDEQLDTLNRIEEYSMKQSDILDTTIIEQNKVTFDIKQDNYALPQFQNITDDMFHRIEDIKNNNYLLPTVEDIKEIPKKELWCPIEIIDINKEQT